MSGKSPGFLNWAGSKARVAKVLRDLVPPGFNTYHEPFLGSGATFLALASAGLITKSCLSDINRHLINVFMAVQTQPNEVVSGLYMHGLLDSDIHFSATLGRLNAKAPKGRLDHNDASDMIYLLFHSFNSTWYETRNSQVSMCRRRDPKPFRARKENVIRAASLLQNATVLHADFRLALERVETGDLVFLDPPYLYKQDQTDQQGYNAARFGLADLQDLSAEIHRLADLGAQVILCWGEIVEWVVPAGGRWIGVGRDCVWLSKGLADLWLNDGRVYSEFKLATLTNLPVTPPQQLHSLLPDR